MGSRSRLLKFEPGVYTTVPFVHDHWEEVYLMSGDLIVGNDAQGRGGEPFMAPTYACRPPGVHHGPFKSEQGCLLFEMHYYDESKRCYRKVFAWLAGICGRSKGIAVGHGRARRSADDAWWRLSWGRGAAA